MKYAHFDPTTPAPHPILGWYYVRDDADPDGFEYRPLPENLAVVPDACWSDTSGRASGGYCVDTSGTVPTVIATPGPAPAQQLAQAQTAQIQILAAACRAQIEAGFDSAALGVAHHYPAGPQDQANLTASVTASLIPNLPAGWTTTFWCADAGGAWNYVDHTASQIQQVGMDGKSATTTALQKNALLRAQVDAATTVAGVQAVTW